MDRLTQKDTVAGMEYFDLKRDIPQIRAIDMLGQYEDTDLTPQEIKQLKAENAKLRAKFDEAMELISRAHQDLHETQKCHDCAYFSYASMNCEHPNEPSEELSGCNCWEWQYQDRYEKIKGAWLNG